MIPHKSFDTIEKIISIMNNREKGAYIRFGDGDLNIMFGQNDSYNVCNKFFTNEVRESICIDHDNYLKGVCLMCNKFGLLEDNMWPGNHEWDEKACIEHYNKIYTVRGKHLTDYYCVVVFNYLLTTYREKSYEYMYQIRSICLKNDVIFIGNKNVKKDIINLYFGNNYSFIECPPRNSYSAVNHIENSLTNKINQNSNYKIIIMCCGITTRCLIKRLWINNNINNNYFILDFGSIIDALSGIISRQNYIETKFDPDLYNNGFKQYVNNN
tara:strand:+ start:929 stop:1735 length:807 start_codon:yes stop_codon:yes gene_type:complete